ncbi:sensor histidine kinase [Halobaculum sp. MBLA0147]|uniref:sensor histidine kinase n=1 Tax=Halobaculum sp. MBLA0147 TaxID=3079934 RepID=UPI003524123E
MADANLNEFPVAVDVLASFPEPVAVVHVTSDGPVAATTNDAFAETFEADTEGLIARSFAVATTDGDPAGGRPGGPVAVQTDAGRESFRVTYLPVETAVADETDVTGGTDATDEGDASSWGGDGETGTDRRTTEVGYLAWTPPPTEGGGRDRFVELHGTTREMLTAESREAVAQVAADAVENVIGFPLNTVRLYTPDPDRLLPTAISTATRSVTPGERPAYERGETIQWRAFDDDEFLVFQDVTTIDDDVERSGSGSMLVAPLGEHGVLTMGTTEPAAISETDLELARVFAANVEAAMDRVERERALRDRERELERQNERLDRFASVLSHDLRNPISIVSGYTEVARSETDSEAVERHLAEVQTAVERMSTLVEQTLTLAREGAKVDERERVCVPDVADRLAEVTTGQGPTLVFPDADGEEPPEWTVSADRERVERILDNLLRNAVEHAAGAGGGGDGSTAADGGADAATSDGGGADGGGVTGTDGDDDEFGTAGGPVTVRIGRIDGEGFYVADDGPGIEPDRREDVFEYGTSYDDGTGLGLAIVAELTRAHGWTVEIEESWAGGARFAFHTGPEDGPRADGEE